jgi:MOSC domain-containing protein YiiM
LVPFEPDETRRNIVVEGADVYALLGREFSIGDVRLRGIEPTRPCHIPSAAANKTGFKEAYSNRGGVRAEILSDGIISVGDAISGDNISVLPIYPRQRYVRCGSSEKTSSRHMLSELPPIADVVERRRHFRDGP